MRNRFAALLVFVATTALGQSAQPTIRVEVKTDSGPVSDATVTANGKSIATRQDGIAVLPSMPGQIAVDVKKDGFFPIHTTVNVEAAQQAQLEIELQPAKAEEEDVVLREAVLAKHRWRFTDLPLHSLHPGPCESTFCRTVRLPCP